MNIEHENIETSSAIPGAKKPAPGLAISDLAASLVKDDFKAYLLTWLALSIIAISKIPFFEIITPGWWIALLVTRIVELGLAFWLGSRAIKRYTTYSPNRLSLAILMTIGMAQWFLYIIPLRFTVPFLTHSSSLSEPDGLASILIILALPALVLAYKLVPFITASLLEHSFNMNSIGSAFKRTLSYGKSLKWISLSILLPPTALSLFLSGLPLVISPDGRLTWTQYLSAVGEASFWPLFVALSIASGILYLQSHESQTVCRLPAKLEPNQTILVQALNPKQSGWLFAIALALWTGNLASLEAAKPAVDITALKSTATGSTVNLKLKLSDPKYNFEGFIPGALRLAGETGVPISVDTAVAKLENSETDVTFGIPGDQSEVTINLSLNADRSADKLALLEDLYLYYRAAKISPLKIRAISEPRQE